MTDRPVSSLTNVSRLRNRHLFFSDVVLMGLAAYLSFVLRLDRLDPGTYRVACLVLVLAAMLVTPLIFYQLGIYSRYWRYAASDEALLLVYGVASAALTVGTVYLLAGWFFPAQIVTPRSVPGIYALLLGVAVATPRALVFLFNRSRQHTGSLPVVIIGAEAGAVYAREMRRDRHSGKWVVGFLDDDPALRGMHIHSVPVLGGVGDLSTVLDEYAVHQVVIATPTVPGKQLYAILQVCEQRGVPAKIMPSIPELLSERRTISQLRDVAIEDLLGRASVQADSVGVKELLRGKRVLITGGGGSIGSELCRQLLRCGPSELVVLGHGENSVFAIRNELIKLAQGMEHNCRISAVIGDVRFPERLRTIFERFRPQVVFHAAAHKHVPLMEENPSEAVTNNVIGTRNVLTAAQEAGVERFVMISSDKAVNPTSLMGVSKRVAELLVLQAAAVTGLPYVAVRFGNVLGSRGSVVLTFRQQLLEGGPLTVTHPEMRRYFMTIPEAVQLVLQAAVLGKGGEVFTLDMGEPVRIVDLARNMIRLSGLQFGRDVDVVFTGMRPGEKLFEELFVKGEVYHRTSHSKILIAGNASSFVPARLDTLVAALYLAAKQEQEGEIIRLMHELVPEYMRHDDPRLLPLGESRWSSELRQQLPSLLEKQVAAG